MYAGGRAALVCGDPLIDVAQRSNHRFAANPKNALQNWATTAEMIFPVAERVSFLSRLPSLQPGDLIFTGTLAAGDVVATEIERLGSLINRCPET